MSPEQLNTTRSQLSPAHGETADFIPKIETIFEEKVEDAAQLGEVRKIIVQAQAVGDVLPAAIAKSAAAGDDLAEVVLPLTENSIRDSVRRDSQILAEALAPIMVPAIGKAIVAALEKSTQSLNQTLEQSLSPKGLKWRIEALQTGKSFAEIVMLRTLLYRVEQVFLIHRDTGLLLQQVTADAKFSEDADLISAMLTAIQDFVSDSFRTSEKASLDTLKMDELSIWIERSSDLIFAAVIRGSAPLDLREKFRGVIEKIQTEQHRRLKNFDGNADFFSFYRPILEDCLDFQTHGDGGKKSSVFAPLNVMSAVLLIGLIAGGFFYVRDYLRWSRYLERLKTENGIVVTESNRGFFTHEIEGLRDPAAIDPAAILSEYGYAANDVAARWKPFQDSSPAFVIERARQILNPPNGVDLDLENGVLVVRGDAPNDWLLDARKISRALPGVSGFRVAR